MKTLITVLAIPLLVYGCSSSPKLPEFDDYLATNIRPDGRKEFQYTMELDDSDFNGQGRARVSGGSSSNTRGQVGWNSGSAQRGGGGRDQYLQLMEMLDENLENSIEQVAYCRSGWTELNRDIQLPTVIIRGYCSEPASDADLAKFPNKA